MNATHDTTTTRLVAALGVVAAAVVAPALLFAGAGTAQADDCYGELSYSYYCSPSSSALDPGAYNPEPVAPAYTPASPNLWSALPGCTGGVLEALDGSC
jgi:hypothetical protein